MAISEADRFQGSIPFGGSPEAESMVNLQTAGEYQNPSEYFAPTTEAELEMELEQEGEQLSERRNYFLMKCAIVISNPRLLRCSRKLRPISKRTLINKG